MVSENKTVMSTVQGVFSPKFCGQAESYKDGIEKSISAVILKRREYLCVLRLRLCLSD